MRQLSTLAAAALLTLSAGAYAGHHNYKGENYKGEATVPVMGCPAERCLMDGPYLGLGVGYDMYRVKQDSTVNGTFGVPFNLNPSLQSQGWMGNIFAGYGQYWNIWYFAGEIFASASDASTSNSISNINGNYNETYNVRSSYGVSVLPGFRTSQSTLIYARLGYTRTSFNVSENMNNGLVGTHTSVTKWANGLNYGMGIETAVYDHVSVRGEYVHTRYDSFTSLVNSNYKPRNNQVIFGVIYHFA